MFIKYPSYTTPGLESAEIGRAYFVNFPYALSHPCINGQTFIAHKNINNPRKWTITHLESGMSFAEGTTRAEAIHQAEARFELFPNASMERALLSGIETYKTREAYNKED